MIKKILSSLFLVICLIFLASPVRAEDEIRNLQVDLKGKGFSQSQWSDNLDSSSIIFSPGSQFQIQLILKNLGNRSQTQIQIGEILPATLTVTDANGATLDGNKLYYTVPQLGPSENHTKTITVTVKDKSKIRQELTKSFTSISARSEAGTTASDTLYFYTGNGSLVNKPATSSATLPKTGANPLLLGTLFGSALLGFAFTLRRFARGY